MNAKITIRCLAVLFVFIFITAVHSAIGQELAPKQPLPPPAVFATFDFSNDFYLMNGIYPRSVIDRRTGTDGWSVFGKSTDPRHNQVRVIGTMPAYNQFGEPMYWYPLGNFDDIAFTEDKTGVRANEAAAKSPIYIFPDRHMANVASVMYGRHAPVIDLSWSTFTRGDLNPLGLREVYVVNYTEKAFGKEGVEMMRFFGKKNGFATDDTPILNCVDDIRYLEKLGFVTVVLNKYADDVYPSGTRYTIAPVITDPKNGAIRPDAFLWMFTKDGQVLPNEAIFEYQFGCLKKQGDWCL
jgi:hypothetical protein